MAVFKILCLCVALILPARAGDDLPSSPCPDLFRYDTIDKSEGSVHATLLAKAPHVLHGVWIRIIFDKDVDELIVGDGFEAVRREGKNGFLVKNKDILLRPGKGKVLKLTVKFSGPEIPVLTEYRLNAVTLCPNVNSNRTDFYPNDPQAASLNFLQSVISKPSDAIVPDYKCGKLVSEQNVETYPWQVSVFIKHNGKETYACEATLVSPQHLITAAHCATFLTTKLQLQPEKLVVYFGKLNIADKGSKPFTISEIRIYPGFQAENLLNDLAILKLQNAVEVTEKLSPICLPKAPASNGDEGLIVGYQLEKDKFGKLTSVKVKRIDDETCRHGSESLKSLLGDNTYCSSYLQDNAICVGDSGSGIISSTAEQWELKGVLSVSVPLQEAPDAIQQHKCDASSNILITDIYRYSRWINGVLFE